MMHDSQNERWGHLAKRRYANGNTTFVCHRSPRHLDLADKTSDCHVRVDCALHTLNAVIEIKIGGTPAFSRAASSGPAAGLAANNYPMERGPLLIHASKS